LGGARQKSNGWLTSSTAENNACAIENQPHVAPEMLEHTAHPMPAPGRARVFEPGPGWCPGSGGPLLRKAPSPPRPSLPRSARAIGTFGVTPATFLRKLVKGDAALPVGNSNVCVALIAFARSRNAADSYHEGRSQTGDLGPMMCGSRGSAHVPGAAPFSKLGAPITTGYVRIRRSLCGQ